MKGRWEQEAGNPGSDTLGDSGNICRADGLGQWPRSPQSERVEHTEPREEAKAHVDLFCFFSWFMSLLTAELR